MSERRAATITFQPTDAVRTLLARAAKERKGTPRSRLINDAIAAALKNLVGKREQLP